MICSNCGTENPAGAKFCTECATRLALACPSCGTANAPTAKFCAECASPLAAAAPMAAPASPVPAAPDSPVAERRLVSILFADLVGFTALADGRDPEETRELLSALLRPGSRGHRPLRRHRREVHRRRGHGGLGRADRPRGRRRAGRSAQGWSSSTRCGRSGHGLAGAGRRPDRRGRGDDRRHEPGHGRRRPRQHRVAASSRVAAPGTVLVGEATQRAASPGDRVRAGRRAGAQGQGRARRRLACRCGSSPSVGGRKHADALEAPFVGPRRRAAPAQGPVPRDDARARGRGSCRVIGPAGIGKSRLAWEFLKYLDGLVETRSGGTTAARPPTATGSAFWALGEMVRRRAGLLETDDEATTRAQGRRDARRARARRRGAALDRAGPPGPARRGRRDGQRRSSSSPPGGRSSSGSPRRRPVVLVFEDFHYADAGLHRLRRPPAGVVARRSRSTSLTLARPELLDGGPDWGAGKRSFAASIPGAAADPRRCASSWPGSSRACPKRGRRRSSPAPTGSRCTPSRRCGCSSPRAGSSLDGGVYRPVGDLTTLAVPETLTALIAAASTPSTRPTAPSSRTPRSSARASRRPGPGGGRGHRPRRRSSRGCALSSGARSWRSRRDPRSPGAGPVRASSRRSSARSPTARWPGATARPGTWPPPATSSRSARTSWRARWPATTSPPTSAPAEARRRTRWPARPGSRCAAAADRAAALGSPEQAVALPRAGARRRDRPGRAGGAPGAARRGGRPRQPLRPGRRRVPPRRRAAPRARRPRGRRAGHRGAGAGEPRRAAPH